MKPPVCIDTVIPVRNSPHRTGRCIESILNQAAASYNLNKIVVVDDASTDDTAEVIHNEFADRVTLIKLAENRGRAAARNIGAARGDGEVLVFIDSDCYFLTDTAIEAHVNKIIQGADASFGRIEVNCGQFWNYYMQKINRRREELANRNDFTLMVSANFAVRRTVFEKHNGFNAGFTSYGFEDRDLVARLIKDNAVLTYTPESRAEHCSDFSLKTIAGKMHESAKYSAMLFASLHPSVYNSLSYSRVDARLNPYLRLPAALLKTLLPFSLKAGQLIINSPVFPRYFKYIIVKTVSAAAFMAGSLHRQGLS